MKQQTRWRILAALGALAIGSCAASGEKQAVVRGPDAQTTEQFVERTENYVKLREEAMAEIPQLKETSAPEEIQAREKAAATAIRQRRAGAKPGDIFGSARAPIVAVVRNDWHKRSAAERAAMLGDGEVGRIPAPAVNSVYPQGVPLASFPPDLLTVLPVLPEQLEYRFAGTHLILLDVEANLVVDVVPSVLDGAVAAARSPGG
jgi:hypothetical protein